MAIVRWDPWDELSPAPRQASEPEQSAGARTAGLVPPLDAYRTNEGLVVRVELPGMRPEDVDVAVDDGILRISGERRNTREVSEDAYIRREHSVGRFARGFSLPEGTDPEAISASFEHGVLELQIPHPPRQQPQRIQVRTRGQSETGGTPGSGGATRIGSRGRTADQGRSPTAGGSS